MDIASFCLSFTPVPGLGKTFDIFKGICAAVEKAQWSKQQLKSLAFSVAKLLEALDPEIKSGRIDHEASSGIAKMHR